MAERAVDEDEDESVREWWWNIGDGDWATTAEVKLFKGVEMGVARS